MSYSEEIAQLVKLETFDVKAFIGDENVPQSVCDLILAFAVAYNDLKDLTLVKSLLDEQRPEDLETETTELGQFNGVVNSVIRLQAGTLNELISLIEKNNDAINHDSFQRLLVTLSKDARNCWDELVLVANKRRTIKQFGKALLLVRHKIAFHYDANIISAGYRECFESHESERVPLISRGNTMHQTRFYFADAATQNYIQSMDEKCSSIDELNGNAEILYQVNLALYELVTKFPPLKGYAWRNHN